MGTAGNDEALRGLASTRWPRSADRLDAYANLLGGDGVTRGLIGPREANRIWERHLLNCAAVEELIPADARVVDVGSGAGLPGIVLAIVRSDITVTLVEPLLRRATFLTEAVVSLGLGDRVAVCRVRAEDLGKQPNGHRYDIATARAVAPLDRLVGWCLPLLRPRGALLALKGERASAEAVAAAASISEAGGSSPLVCQCGRDWLPQPTTVVRVYRAPQVSGVPPTRRSS